MNLFVILLLGISCGYLVWRGSHSLRNAILAGFVFPVIGIIAFGAAIGRDSLETLPFWMVVVGATAALGVIALFLRKL